MISNGSAILLLLSITLVHSLIIPSLPTCLDLHVDLLFLFVIPRLFSPLFQSWHFKVGFYCVLFGISLFFF